MDERNKSERQPDLLSAADRLNELLGVLQVEATVPQSSVEELRRLLWVLEPVFRQIYGAIPNFAPETQPRWVWQPRVQEWIAQARAFLQANPNWTAVPADSRSSKLTSRQQSRAFVMMPFTEELDWLWALIREAGDDVGVIVERADDTFAAGIVIDQVRERIRDADVVIAVCTGRNANVFYELGIAEAFHRPILIGAGSSDLPFDIQHFRAQFYGGPKGRTDLRDRLRRSMMETLADKPGAEPSRGPRQSDPERESMRLREDLDDVLEEIAESERNATNGLDEDLISRGVLNSSMRIDGRRRIAEEHQRRRDRAIRDWQRRVENLGLETPDPPPSPELEQ